MLEGTRVGSEPAPSAEQLRRLSTPQTARIPWLSIHQSIGSPLLLQSLSCLTGSGKPLFANRPTREGARGSAFVCSQRSKERGNKPIKL